MWLVTSYNLNAFKTIFKDKETLKTREALFNLLVFVAFDTKEIIKFIVFRRIAFFILLISL